MGVQSPILDSLAAELYLVGDAVSDRYAVDWSAESPSIPEVVLLPRTTDDVSSMLILCHAAGQSIVVQGGMTGLSGGATPQKGEWALSLQRLNHVFEVDESAMTMTVGAGTPLETIQEVAEDAGFRFPLDLGARGSCVAGGIVATNAGGNEVIQHGMTRALVLGLVAVLADGTVIPARNKLLKNNAGFDLKQLFIGSEGALGIVTEVTFRLVAQKPYRQTALCAITSFDHVVAFLKRMMQELDVVSSFEVMWADYYRESLRATGIGDPLEDEHNYYVVIETEGANETSVVDRFQAALLAEMEEGLLRDAVISHNTSQARTFWMIRDGIAELLPEFEPAATFDIGIPISSMDQFAIETRAELVRAFPDCRMLVFGHIGDGNLHLLVTTGQSEDKQAIYELVYRKIRDVCGTITAEHGIGVLKKQWLSYTRSDAEILLMKQLKSLLDPDGILNSGRVI